MNTKVLHVYRTYFPGTQGGLEETIRQICATTRGLEIESRVLVLSQKPDPAIVKFDDVEVTRAKNHFEIASCSISLNVVKRFRALTAWVDVIHYHFRWPFADFLEFIVRPGKPALVTYHSDVVRQRVLGKIYAPLQNWFLRRVEKIVCTSPQNLQTSPVLQEHASKVASIPIGLDPSRYLQPRESITRSLRAEFGSQFFLFVGVLRYYKGLHVLLEETRGAPFKVLIVGSGPEEESLARHADKLHGDPQLGDQMGKHAKKRYMRLFTGKLMGERYAATYRELVAERSGL